MRFWVYSIDWRSLAVNVIAECTSEHAAEAAHAAYVDSLTGDALLDMIEYRTIAITPTSPQMEFAREQFRRVNGRSMAAAAAAS